MSEVKGAGERLVKLVQAQGALYKEMLETTKEALVAAEAGDIDIVEVALARREGLIKQIDKLQDEERELRGKVPNEQAARLNADKELHCKQLQQINELGERLKKELSTLKQRTADKINQITKLKQTAKGYRPKDASSEGLFVDWRR
jgi:chromosome segregation ATPase